MIKPQEFPACWSWPVTEEHRERAFRAGRDKSRSAALTLAKDWQADRCAICGHHNERMVSDHDHDTGSFRGRLCGSCNAQEGHAADDALLYARYRSAPPAVILGLSVRWARPNSPRVIMAALGPDPAEAMLRHLAETDPARRG